MMKPRQASWKSRSVLVTGATGFVGGQLVHQLLDLGATLVCLVRDHDPASVLWRSGDVERVAVASGQLEDFNQVKAALVEREIDTVFHLGAQALVGPALCDPLATFESNVRGTANLLEACRLYGDRVGRIVIASSDKAYGECDGAPYVEQTRLAAKNPYDVSKSCADLISQAYAHTYRLPIAIARCGNIFGPGDLNWSRLVPGVIRALLNEEAPVIRSDGTPKRDFLYVQDAVDAYLMLASWLDGSSHRADPQRAFNFSANLPLTVLDMVRLIGEACDRPELAPIVQGLARNEISAQHLDSTRAGRELGWTARHNVTHALRETVAWYRWHLKRPAASARPRVIRRALAAGSRSPILNQS